MSDAHPDDRADADADADDLDDLDAIDGLINDDGVTSARTSSSKVDAPTPMFSEKPQMSADEILAGLDDVSSLESMFESTLADLERVTAERDEYLDLARRVQAEFENYKRRVTAQRADEAGKQAEAVVAELLPVLDAGEAAISHGVEDVVPVHNMLEQTLVKLGLTKVDEIDAPFDPNVHEAVMSEPGDGVPSVAEVLRTGYSWKGRVVRPAMVKVRG